MKKNMVLFNLLVLLVFALDAQDIDVIETVIIPTGESRFTSPQFSPDGKKILFTEFGARGLWLYDISERSLVQINDLIGAGYRPRFSPDGRQLIFRVDEFIDMRKYSSLAIQSIGSPEIEYLTEKTRFLTPVLHLETNRLLAVSDKKIQRITIDKNKRSSPDNTTEMAVYIEDQQIALLRNGKKQFLRPLGDGNYIWPSLSPDGTRILFTLAGKGTYICDLDGNIQKNLGFARAPRWSPDGRWIAFMLDYDDGHAITASDIWVVDGDNARKTQLTRTPNRIEMYPAWSPGMDKIAFDTAGGQIGYLKIEISE